jgi:hypothetical protein
MQNPLQISKDIFADTYFQGSFQLPTLASFLEAFFPGADIDPAPGTLSG